MNIALDTGNKSIKTKNFLFTSGVAERPTEPTMCAKTDWIKFNGKYYVLSERRGEYLRDKSQDNRYFILSLFGICKELDLSAQKGEIVYDKDETYPIRLLTGLPPAHMEDGKLKKKYRNYFHTDAPISVFYNNRSWTIDVQSVRVYAQCFAALMSKPEISSTHNRILAIDIGGLTSDYMELIRGKITPEHTDSMEQGVIPFYRNAASVCRKRFDAIVDETDVDEMLIGDASGYDAEIVSAVKGEAEKYVDKFLSTFRELQIDLRTAYVVFMGGGSILLWEFIQKSPLLKNCTLLPEIKANAIGYDMIYRMLSKNVGE